MTQIIGEQVSYLDKAKELCQAMLDDSKLQSAFKSIDAFMENDGAKEIYAAMQAKAEELHQKQHAGLELSAGEIEEYNKLRDKVVENSTAKDFIDAQEEMHSVQATVNGWLSLTFELGRMPTDADFEEHNSGCCSSGGCGCN